MIMNTIHEKYNKEIVKTLKKEYGIKNNHAVPRLTKIVVNMGVGKAIKDKSILEAASNDLMLITGQKPSIRRAKVSVASFSLRQGMNVGLKVTIRRERMYDFLQRLVTISLPRLRDFRGISTKSFDKHGNYTLGIEDHTIFTEIDMSKSPMPHGLEITFVTSTKDPDLSRRLLELLGLPFEKGDQSGKDK